MPPRLRTLEDLGDVSGRRVFLRVDFNVPLQDGAVADDFRIRAALPTIQELLGHDAIVILASHLGRPKGQVRPELRLDPIAVSLWQLLDRTVTKVDEVVGAGATKAVREARPGEIVLLENLRFHPGEEANDRAFADALAALGDVYVNDAFGAAHRAHASVVGVASRLPSAAGRLLQREVEVLSRLLESPDRPYVAILGGAKISDKLGVLRSLVERVDALLVGGAMAFSLIAVQGGQVGDSLVEPDRYDDVRAALEAVHTRGVPVALPEDVVAAAEVSATAPTRTVEADRIPAGLKGLDIGPRTVEEFARAIADARTVLWNGPMGVFELEPFAAGTLGVAKAVAAADAYSVVGGGDSLLALRKAGLEDAIDHLSTGGGASLEFLEGAELPGVKVLEEADGG